MKARRLFLALSFVVCFAVLPKAAAAEAMFTEMDLFISGHDQFNIYRIPWLVFVNPTAGRTNLTVRLSTDDGKTWSIARTVQPGQAAYTGMAFLKDGAIGVLYETGKMHLYEKVTFARFNLEWLTGP